MQGASSQWRQTRGTLLSGATHSTKGETDEEGRFTLRWSQDLPATLALEHPRYQDLTAAAAPLEAEGDFTLRPSGRIEGQVREIGRASCRERV